MFPFVRGDVITYAIPQLFKEGCGFWVVAVSYHLVTLQYKISNTGNRTCHFKGKQVLIVTGCYCCEIFKIC